ncbi:MAG: hypothetical protein AAF333_02540 [Planctomycetota bacterium]
MLPSQTQRGLMLVATLLGVVGWGWAAGRLQPSDGWGVGAVVVFALAGLPAVLAAAAVAAGGNPLSAVVSLTLAGAFAAHGQSFGSAVRRADDTGAVLGMYSGWGVRLLAWFVFLIAAVAVLEWARPRLRPKLGKRLTSRHLADGSTLWGVDGTACVAALITAAVGAVLTMVLVQSADTGQVRGGLVLGFALAALVGFAVAPTKRPGLVLLSPGAVVLGGYVWATRRFFWNVTEDETPYADAFFAAFYRGELPGVAVVLPVHAVTAGVLGCAIGVGVGQVLEKAKLGQK